MRPPDASPDQRAPAAPPRRSRWVLIPPPFLLMGTLAVALRLQRAWPRHFFPATARRPLETMGYVAMGMAAALVINAALAFVRRRATRTAPGATPSPRGPVGVLIVDGPYRVSRHPMYLLYLGITFATDMAWPLLLLPLPLWVIDRRIIPFEEQTLAAAFGDAYRVYQDRVRRWL
jgi:protein-S-isoprenylcysteine O-methyltransferase Ste14